MSTVNVTIRMDDELKKQAEILFSDLGLNMTTAFTVFVKQAVREQRIPFTLTKDPFYSESNMAHLRRGIAALNAGKGVEHEPFEVEGE
jgi:DNA-damage-inducible protein J